MSVTLYSMFGILAATQTRPWLYVQSKKVAIAIPHDYNTHYPSNHKAYAVIRTGDLCGGRQALSSMSWLLNISSQFYQLIGLPHSFISIIASTLFARAKSQTSVCAGPLLEGDPGLLPGAMHGLPETQTLWLGITSAIVLENSVCSTTRRKSPLKTQNLVCLFNLGNSHFLRRRLSAIKGRK